MARLAAEQQAAARGRIAAHVQAGRVLPAEAEPLTALCASLAGTGEGGAIALTGADGTATRASPADVLEAFLKGLPRRGPELRELSGEARSAAPGADLWPQTPQRDAPDRNVLARRANALLAADTTGTLTLDVAVRQVLAGETAHA